MYLTFHLLIFGGVISIIDIATHRIFRATIAIALVSLVGSVPMAEWCIGFLLYLIGHFSFRYLEQWMGYGDILLLPLVSIYARNTLTGREILIAFFAILTFASIRLMGETGKRESRLAASPSLFLFALIFGEIASTSAII